MWIKNTGSDVGIYFEVSSGNIFLIKAWKTDKVYEANLQDHFSMISFNAKKQMT